jgi:hypothetical protein
MVRILRLLFIFLNQAFVRKLFPKKIILIRKPEEDILSGLSGILLICDEGVGSLKRIIPYINIGVLAK